MKIGRKISGHFYGFVRDQKLAQKSASRSSKNGYIMEIPQKLFSSFWKNSNLAFCKWPNSKGAAEMSPSLVPLALIRFGLGDPILAVTQNKIWPSRPPKDNAANPPAPKESDLHKFPLLSSIYMTNFSEKPDENPRKIAWKFLKIFMKIPESHENLVKLWKNLLKINSLKNHIIILKCL